MMLVTYFNMQKLNLLHIHFFFVFLCVLVAISYAIATHIVMPASRGEPLAKGLKALPIGIPMEKVSQSDFITK